jgi:hypothetical protein
LDPGPSEASPRPTAKPSLLGGGSGCSFLFPLLAVARFADWLLLLLVEC